MEFNANKFAAGAQIVGGVTAQGGGNGASFLSGTASGAAAGAALGPVGAAVGGAIGGITSLIGARKQKKAERKMKAAQRRARQQNAIGQSNAILSNYATQGIKGTQMF